MSIKTQPQNVNRASAYQNLPAQNIPNNVWTPLRLDAEHFDSLNELSLVTDRFTPVNAGYYLVTVRATFQAVLAVSARLLTIYGNTGTFGYAHFEPQAVWQVQSLETSAVVYLTPNDYVEGYIWQGSGAGENLVSNQPYQNMLMVHRLS